MTDEREKDNQPVGGGLSVLRAQRQHAKGFVEGLEARRVAHAVGAAIRSAREAEGLTQKELAKRIGMRQSEVSRIENASGSAGPGVETLSRAAKALGRELVITLEPSTNLTELPETDLEHGQGLSPKSS